MLPIFVTFIVLIAPFTQFSNYCVYILLSLTLKAMSCLHIKVFMNTIDISIICMMGGIIPPPNIYLISHSCHGHCKHNCAECEHCQAVWGSGRKYCYLYQQEGSRKIMEKFEWWVSVYHLSCTYSLSNLSKFLDDFEWIDKDNKLVQYSLLKSSTCQCGLTIWSKDPSCPVLVFQCYLTCAIYNHLFFNTHCIHAWLTSEIYIYLYVTWPDLSWKCH